MGLENIKVGYNIPDDINVIIEISSRSYPVKYEFDKSTEMVTVDRFLGTSMIYPCEYGFIPHTLSEDGDPLDVLVVTPFPIIPGSIIRCRPIGMLRMTDESGPDTKILAVPINKLSPKYQHVQKPTDLGQDFLDTVAHFFKHYKDLEEGKWSKIDGWENGRTAREEILSGVARYRNKVKV